MSPDMIAMITLAAFGSIALFQMLGDDGDDTPQDDPSLPDEPQSEGTVEDDVITAYDPDLDANSMLSALAGDDEVLIDSQNDPFAFDISLGDGDDSLEFGLQCAPSKISAGTGDDLLRGSNVEGDITLDEGDDTVLAGVVIEGDIDGGAGSDVIAISNYTTSNGFIRGGAGDDTISTNVFNATVLGEEGDDVIELLETTPARTMFFELGGDVDGGAGADTFIVAPRLTAAQLESQGYDPMVDTAPWVFLDISFEPGIDHLVLDPAANVRDYEFTGYDIHPASAGETDNEIVLNYARIGNPDQTFQMLARLAGDPIGPGDITVITG